MALDPKRIINGTYGEAWCDDEYLSNVKALQAKIEINKEDVPIAGKLSVGKKITGWTGTGSVTLHKVNSGMAKKMLVMLREGKSIESTIISKLADPDSFGAERIVLKGVMFDDLTLADWESGTLGQVEMPFTFTDFEYLDMI